MSEYNMATKKEPIPAGSAFFIFSNTNRYMEKLLANFYFPIIKIQMKANSISSQFPKFFPNVSLSSISLRSCLFSIVLQISHLLPLVLQSQLLQQCDIDLHYDFLRLVGRRGSAEILIGQESGISIVLKDKSRDVDSFF